MPPVYSILVPLSASRTAVFIIFSRKRVCHLVEVLNFLINEQVII